jgi:phosphoribosyl-AMP cyclohydrolase / phosphoribosyl-ATP pyrophosphohydrolase
MKQIRNIDINALDFAKGDGLIPVIVQDESTLQVLMQAFMNREALVHTMQKGRVTFFSRSKNRLWTKGETSGNYLFAKEILADCDNDCLLIKAEPKGPACHTGSISCFDVGKTFDNESKPTADTLSASTIENTIPDTEVNQVADEEYLAFLGFLEQVLRERRLADTEKSYTAKLFAAGPKRIAKKLGEEAFELALEAESGDPERFTEEAADLIYHFTVLLIQKGLGWKEVIAELRKRHA